VTYAPPPIFLRAPPDRATAAVLFIVVVVADGEDDGTRRDNVRAILDVVAANMMVDLFKFYMIELWYPDVDRLLVG